MSFQDQGKLLEEVVFSLAVSINANIKNSQIKHCSCPKYVAIKRPNLHLHNLKKHLKNNHLKNFKLCHHKKANINIDQKSKMVQIEMYNLQTRLAHYKDQKKAKNVRNS